MFSAAESAFIIRAEEILPGPRPSLFLVALNSAQLSNGTKQRREDILRNVLPELVPPPRANLD